MVQNTLIEQPSYTAKLHQHTLCASRTVSLKEAAPTSTSTRRKRSSQEKAEPPKKRSRKPATVQISDGGQAAGIEDIEEGVNILPKMYERNSVLSWKKAFWIHNHSHAGKYSPHSLGIMKLKCLDCWILILCAVTLFFKFWWNKWLNWILNFTFII